MYRSDTVIAYPQSLQLLASFCTVRVELQGSDIAGCRLSGLAILRVTIAHAVQRVGGTRKVGDVHLKESQRVGCSAFSQSVVGASVDDVF